MRKAIRQKAEGRRQSFLLAWLVAPDFVPLASAGMPHFGFVWSRVVDSIGVIGFGV
jgi:hypothetical protein